MTEVIGAGLLTSLIMTAAVMLTMRSAVGALILSGAYSLLAAAMFLIFDAVDVALTEAAVGGGVSTVLMLAALLLTASRHTKTLASVRPQAVVAAVTLFGLLAYGSLGLPPFGQADAPVHSRVSQRYILESGGEVGPPNIVTSVLASYRGYDTLGETVVIFTAGLAVLCLLGGGRRKVGVNTEKGSDR